MLMIGPFLFFSSIVVFMATYFSSTTSTPFHEPRQWAVYLNEPWDPTEIAERDEFIVQTSIGALPRFWLFIPKEDLDTLPSSSPTGSSSGGSGIAPKRSDMEIESLFQMKKEYGWFELQQRKERVRRIPSVH